MQVFIYTVLLLALCVIRYQAAKLPTYVKACSRNDPNLNKCALVSSKEMLAAIIEKGDRKYNIPVLDPLVVTAMEINHSGLKIAYEDMEFQGLKNVTVQDIRIDLKKGREEFDLTVPRLDIKYKYKVTGRIMILPITGSGTGTLTLTDLKILFAHDFDLVKKKNGKQHMVVKNTIFESEPKLMKMRMENLFNGDRLLGENMNEFLNENWREIHREIGPSFNAAIGKVADQIFNGLTSIVPYDELYTENV